MIEHRIRRRWRNRLAIASAFVAVLLATVSAQEEGFRFTSGIELVNVTATVTDDRGRFIDQLRKDDFTLFENNVRQEISHFSAGKVPVSLGIALDTSASMTEEKMNAARAAIDRLVFDLLDKEDELFFLRFSSTPQLVQGWTRDKYAIRRAVDRVSPAGGTAIYDAVAHALPIAAEGKNRKKAILVISDGNDTNSDVSVMKVRDMIRESDVLVYALGVDGTTRADPILTADPRPAPWPFPWPGSGSGRGRRFPPVVIDRGSPRIPPRGDRVNADALRFMTDDTGGRTEIVRGFRGLEEATARLADELSRQYSLGYSSTEPKDGRWHPIRVEVRDRKLLVRARRGYLAS
jgi:Ca-activated chloride channel homolog